MSDSLQQGANGLQDQVHESVSTFWDGSSSGLWQPHAALPTLCTAKRCSFGGRCRARISCLCSL